jgi:hypothetical protein
VHINWLKKDESPEALVHIEKEVKYRMYLDENGYWSLPKSSLKKKEPLQNYLNLNSANKKEPIIPINPINPIPPQSPIRSSVSKEKVIQPEENKNSEEMKIEDIEERPEEEKMLEDEKIELELQKIQKDFGVGDGELMETMRALFTTKIEK